MQRPDVATASDDYARRFAGPVGRFFLDVQTRTVLRLLRPWPGASVLDVGGGHSQLAVPLARGGFQVTVTGSHASCRQRLDRVLPPQSFRFVEADPACLPLPDGSFDCALAVRLLSHVDDWPSVVAELCRVARRAVVIDYPDLRSINWLARPLFRLKKAVEQNTRPFACFRRRDMLAQFRRSGFGDVQFIPQFLLPMALHRALGSAAISRTIEHVARKAGLTHCFGSPVIACARRSDEEDSPRPAN